MDVVDHVFCVEEIRRWATVSGRAKGMLVKKKAVEVSDRSRLMWPTVGVSLAVKVQRYCGAHHT